MFLLRLLNLILLLSFVGCLAGALAGLIIFAPFVGGAWFLTLIAIAGSDGNETAIHCQEDVPTVKRPKLVCIHANPTFVTEWIE